MEEYIKELQDKVGLTADQARKAIEAIVGKVKSKIPESLHGSIDSIFSQQTKDKVAQLQQQAEAYAAQATDKVKTYADQAKTELGSLSGQAEDLAHGMQQKAQDAVKDLGDQLSGLFGKKTPSSGDQA